MRGKPLSKKMLIQLYLEDKMSSKEIGDKLKCSANKVDYWLGKHLIQKRNISEATYIRQNPKGDPFSFKKPQNSEEWFLFGLGVGLYWGEGNKKNTFAVRLGNTDPHLIKKFIEFLKRTYRVEDYKFRFGLQIFSDMSIKKTLQFWCETLGVSKEQFMKPIVTQSHSIGTYREKTKYGVLTVYVSNKKLRDALCGEIERLR